MMARKVRPISEADSIPGKVVWVPKYDSPFPEVPPEAGVNPLLLVALYAVYAINNVDDASVDPDWTVDVLDGIYGYLGQVESNVLIEEMERLIAYARRAKWPKKLISQLKEDLKAFKDADEPDPPPSTRRPRKRK